LTQQTAVVVVVAPAFAAGFFLRFMVAANPRCGRLQRRALSVRQPFKSRFEFGLRQLQGLHTARLKPVETAGVLEHGGIATQLHVGQNRGDTLFNRCIGIG
jgi:hypothetical protein